MSQENSTLVQETPDDLKGMQAIIQIVNSLLRHMRICKRAIALMTKNNAWHTDCMICTWVYSKVKPTYHLGTINQNQSKQEDVRKSKVHLCHHKPKAELCPSLWFVRHQIKFFFLNKETRISKTRRSVKKSIFSERCAWRIFW